MLIDIKDLNWNLSKRALQDSLEDPVYNLSDSEYVHGKCLFWGKKCAALFFYSSNPECIKRIEVCFFNYRECDLGTEAEEFRKIFYLLRDTLGEPSRFEYIDLDELNKLENVYKELSYKKLPRIIWKIEGKQIVHRFKDYWGMIPDTYIELI